MAVVHLTVVTEVLAAAAVATILLQQLAVLEQ
jgi:hypothetical protein